MGHHGLAVEIGLLVPVHDERETIVHRRHSGLLDVFAEQIVDQRRFSRGVISQEQNRGQTDGVTFRNAQPEAEFIRQRRERGIIDILNLSLQRNDVIHGFCAGGAATERLIG